LSDIDHRGEQYRKDRRSASIYKKLFGAEHEILFQATCQCAHSLGWIEIRGLFVREIIPTLSLFERDDQDTMILGEALGGLVAKYCMGFFRCKYPK